MNRIFAAALAAALVLTACGGDDDGPDATGAASDTGPVTDAAPDTQATEPSDAPTATEAPATEAPTYGDGGAGDGAGAGEGAAGLQLADTEHGSVIADAEGLTLYLFTPDAQGDSTCYDSCAANWPPVPEVTDVGEGLDAALLGTTTRTDGSVQATYNDWPLYYFAGDSAAGMTNGQGLQDVWWVVDAAGEAVQG